MQLFNDGVLRRHDFLQHANALVRLAKACLFHLKSFVIRLDDSIVEARTNSDPLRFSLRDIPALGFPMSNQMPQLIAVHLAFTIIAAKFVFHSDNSL